MRPAVLLLALAVFVGACATPRTDRIRSVPQAASAAMAEGQAALRSSDDDANERARAAFERASAAAPDWVAPRRALDELLRADLRALDALAAYRAALADGTADAATLYLAGRLEGRDGGARFERAARLDPLLAWAWHGLAFRGGVEDGRSPRSAAQRALALSRDPWERTFFTASLARFEAAAGRPEAAIELIEQRARDPETTDGDRTALLVQAALTELRAPQFALVERGGERALALLRSMDPTDVEVVDLVTALDSALGGPNPGRVALALAARPGGVRDRLRAEILVERSPSPLALGLLERGLAASGGSAPRGSLLRAARFAAGDFAGATERWLQDLPAVVLTPEGLPRNALLERVVVTARALRTGEEGPALDAFCSALVDAGWFREARAVAARLASRDLDRAVLLDTRALSGMTFLASVRRLLDTIDSRALRGRSIGVAASSVGDGAGREDPEHSDGAERESREHSVGAEREDREHSDGAEREITAHGDGAGAPTRSPESATASVLRASMPSRVPTTLDELLLALAPHAAEERAFRGGETDLERTSKELLASPRRSYVGLAEVVHPGPTLSREDEHDGLGRAGTAVGGLAHVLRELGRFGIFGELAGDAPDGTILPLLALEERAGKHLGVAWHGTVAWCEGADLPSRAGRRGARIAGAALHEGYWIDVDQVRNELASWEELARDFGASHERVQRALDVRGLIAATGEDGARERTTTSALLDEASRVRLAVLRDRAVAGETLGAVTLDELLAVCAAHEEGHLCDRTRFLPLSRGWPRALTLLANQGFSPRRVQEELEYRAQLTAIAAAADPRVALAQVLDGVEGGLGATPHSVGYGRLLDEMLQLLDRDVQRGEFPDIARDRTLVHQLHRLGPEELRRIAVALAHYKRMDG